MSLVSRLIERKHIMKFFVVPPCYLHTLPVSHLNLVIYKRIGSIIYKVSIYLLCHSLFQDKYEDSDEIPVPWLVAKMSQLHLEVYTHNFTLNYPLGQGQV